MQKLVTWLPLLIFIAATVMLIWVLDAQRALTQTKEFGLALVAVAVSYVASAIAFRFQDK